MAHSNITVLVSDVPAGSMVGDSNVETDRDGGQCRSYSSGNQTKKYVVYIFSPPPISNKSSTRVLLGNNHYSRSGKTSIFRLTIYIIITILRIISRPNLPYDYRDRFHFPPPPQIARKNVKTLLITSIVMDFRQAMMTF